MHILDSYDSLVKKYSDGKITLDQYYSGLADLSFMRSHPGAKYDGKDVVIKQIMALWEFRNLNKHGTSEKIEFEVDDYHLQRLRELGLTDDDEDDVNQYISRI